MAGRPVLLEDPKRRAKVLEALEAGSPQKRAAQAGGVDPDTLRVYLLGCADDDASEERAGFPALVEEAKAIGFQANLKLTKKIAKRHWKSHPTAALKAIEMLWKVGGDLPQGGGPSIEADFDEGGRLKSLKARTGGDVEELTDDEIARKLEGMGGSRAGDPTR